MLLACHIRSVSLLATIVLAGCASQLPSAAALSYVRADGRPTDTAQVRLTLAQCPSDGATAVGDYVTGERAVPWAAGMISRSSQETGVVNGCMARNGYLAQLR